MENENDAPATPSTAVGEKFQCGMPTLRGVDHVALSVPDLDGAIAFFCDVLGCSVLYRHGPYVDASDGPCNFFARFLELHPRTEVSIAMLRCGDGANIELFDFRAPDQRRDVPRFTDVGAMHLTFYVADVDQALVHLRKAGAHIMGDVIEPAGPEGGGDSRAVFFKTPWGQMLELVSYPSGRAYERSTTARLWNADRPETWV